MRFIPQFLKSAGPMFQRVFSVQESFGPIGLEFGQDSLNLVQLSRQGGGSLNVQAWSSLPYIEARDEVMASPQKLKAILDPVLKEAGFRGREIVTVLPADELRIMTINYQVERGQEDAEVILAAMRDRVEGDLADYVIDYLPVRGLVTEIHRTGMVALAKRSRVLAHLELLRKAGFSVSELEIGPAAIRRLVASMADPVEGEGALVINCGYHQSYLTVVSGRRLLLDEEIQFGEAGLVSNVAQTLDMPMEQIKAQLLQFGIWPEDQASAEESNSSRYQIAQTLKEIVTPNLVTLVEEINRVLIYSASATHGEQVKYIYLVGSIARWRGVDLLLSQLLGMSVIGIPDPLSPFRHYLSDEPAFDGEPVPQLAIATGLALRGMDTNV